MISNYYEILGDTDIPNIYYQISVNMVTDIGIFIFLLIQLSLYSDNFKPIQIYINNVGLNNMNNNSFEF